MRTKSFQLAAAALLLIFGLAVWGQSQKSAQPSPSPSPSPSPTPAAQATTPQARPGDVDTLDHILAAVYDSISGPAGPRDWDRFRSLFYPGAHLIPTFVDPTTKKPTARFLTPDEYAQRGQAFFDKEGFFEVAVANRIDQWDRIAHVWSTYESRHAKGEKPFARGINSMSLFFDGQRWWIVQIMWDAEAPGQPIPDKYLH
jgi:hypothetical protein